MATRVEASDSLDDFPTQPWGTRALMEHVIGRYSGRDLTCWEPACNRGYMARPLAEYFGKVWASDVHDYGFGDKTEDFLFCGSGPDFLVDWVISNPPFRLAEQFIVQAQKKACVGVAMLVRTSFLESVGRYKTLFLPNPPTLTAIFTERLPLVKGRVDRKASTATSYSWLVWAKGVERLPLVWIPPCRRQLERESDYP